MKSSEMTPRDRCLEEIQRLRREILGCFRCARLREQIVDLVAIMPPEPIIVGNQKWEYVGPWPPFPIPHWPAQWMAVTREHLYEEVRRIEVKIQECGHCGALAGQMHRLSEIMPSDAEAAREFLMYVLFNPCPLK
jgi:hypothetical protein